jgi:PKD repeat protein
VRTLLDLHGQNTRIYEVHGAITQEWAGQMLGLGYSPDLVIAYDRVTGDPTVTLQDVANGAPGSYEESFHFVLNNYVAYDTRIPPYGFSYDEAKKRNALPVPYTQYGNPGPGGAYNYWDEVQLNPPAGAESADIRLLFQPTSWEYVQFLHLANYGQNPFLAETGRDFLDAWLNTGMAEPHVMATATWVNSGAVANQAPTAAFTFSCTDLSCDFNGSSSSDPDGTIVDYAWDFGGGNTATGATPTYAFPAAGTYPVTLTVTDDEGASASQTQDVTVSAANQAPTASFTVACTDLSCRFDGSASNDTDGNIVNYAWDFGDGATAGAPVVDHTYAAAGTYTVTLTVTDDAGASATSVQNVSVTTAAAAEILVDSLASWLLDGTDALISQTSVFNRGDRIGILSRLIDPNAIAVEGASVTVEIRDAGGAVVTTLVSRSDASGDALGAWQTTAPRGRGRWATAGTPTGSYTAEVVDVVKDGYTLNLDASVTTVTFTIL